MVKRILVFAFLCGIAGSVAAVDCPFGIPVVTLAPHTVNGFSWGNVIRPNGDACVDHIVVDPTNDAAWYVGGFNGLYMTKNNGLTWTQPLAGIAGPLLLVPGSPQRIYVGIANKLYLTTDAGLNWTLIRTFPATVRSLLVASNRLYVGLGWSTHAVPSGIWMCSLNGVSATFYPFGPGHTGLIVWTLSRDPVSGAIYAGTEIFDHPSPYEPPFFRSTSAAVWTDVSNNLPWHAVDSDVRPDGWVYALTEGSGVYISANNGATWHPPTLSPGLGNSMLMDPIVSTRLYVGRQKYGTLDGGLFLSVNSGSTYQSIGLSGVTVGDETLNGTGSRIYAAAYASGIYTSVVP